MTVLIHNTPYRNAMGILKYRRLIANVERGRVYGHLGGPFFFVEGQDGTEVPSGGKRHDTDLYFECDLPREALSRDAINGAILSGNDTGLRDRIVIGINSITGTIEQAIIMPDVRACLRLVRIEWRSSPERPSRLLKLPRDKRPFEVLLPTTQ